MNLNTMMGTFIQDVAFSNDGSMLATGDYAKKTTIYDVKTKAKIHEFKHDGSVNSVAFSKDGSMLATGDGANKTTIYDVKTNAKFNMTITKK